MNATDKNIYNTTLMILDGKKNINKKIIINMLNKIIDIFNVACNKTEILRHLFNYYLIKE